MRRSVATDPQRRAEALHLAAEFGPAEASRRTGIPAGTIRAWRARGGGAGPPAGADASSSAQRRERGATSTWEVALSATRKALELIKANDLLGAQRAMISAGIAADKSGQLEEAAGRSHERQVRISTHQAELIAAVLNSFLEALGLSRLPAAPQIMRGLLAQVVAGEPIVVSPADAEAAQQELRDAIEQRLNAAPPRRDLPAISEAGAGKAQKLHVLLEPSPVMAPADHPDRDDDLHLAPAVEGVAPVEHAVEVVDAEIVYDDEVPQHFLDGYGSERLARPAWERAKARARGRERREAERPPSLIVTRPSAHHIGSPNLGGPGGAI